MLINYLNIIIMDKMKFKCLLLVICFISCKKKDFKEVYYPSGNLKSRIHINEHNIMNGLYEEYYESGEQKIKSIYRNGLIVDTVFTYYKNGKIESKGKQMNSLPFGWCYYNDSKGKLNEKREILIIHGKPFLNQIIKYNSNGKIDYKNSSFFELKIKDTLFLGGNKGEIFYHHDTLGFQKRYIRIIIDNQYFENLVKKDTFVGNENKNWFGIYNNKIGKKTVSGIVEEQLIFVNENKFQPKFIIRTYTKHFKKEVYVKSKT